MPMNPRLLRPAASGFNPKQISGLALWLDGADSSSLYTTDAGPVTAVSAPTEISGCVGWWDASDASTLFDADTGSTLATTTVGRWADKSGQGNHLLQATAGSRPSITASALNGRPVVTFDGTDDFLRTASFTLNQPYEYLMVFRFESAFVAASSPRVIDAATPGTRSGEVYRSEANDIRLFAGAILAGYAVPAGQLQQFNQWSFQFNNTSSVLRYRDGAYSVSGAAGAGNGSRITLGSDLNTVASSFSNISVAEVIVFSGVLSVANRARVEKYLQEKYALAAVHAPATATSDPVGYWRDKSGNGHIASTTDSTKRPVITTINGRNALDFDGTNDNLIIQGYTAENGRTGLTRYAVARLDANQQCIMTATSDNGINNAGGARFVNSQGTDVQFAAGNSGFSVTSANVANSTYTLLRDSQRLLGVTYDGSKATVAEAVLAHYNGATLPPTSTTGSVISPLVSGGTRLHIGSNVNANNWWNGVICEYLVYTRTLSATERTRIERYLAAKWGITLAPQVSNADAQDWVNRVYANGGTVSASTASAVNSFCGAIDAAGIRDRFYRLNLFAGTGLNAALVPLYRGPSRTGTQYGNATDTNNGPFVSGDYAETGASGGLNGNGSSKYLATGLNPYDAGLAETDFHTAGYFKDAINTSGVFIGCVSSNASRGVVFHPAFQTLGMYVRFGGLVNSGIENGALAARSGLLMGVRRPGGVGFRNGTNINATSNTTGSNAWAASADSPALFVFARNDTQASPSLQVFNGRSQGYSIGLGMSDAQAGEYYTAMQAFQTSLSRNL